VLSWLVVCAVGMSSMHRFLRVRGGFLSGAVDREDGAAILTLRFHDVDGAVQFEDRMEAHHLETVR